MFTLKSFHNLFRNLVLMYFIVAKGRVHSQIQVMIGRRQDVSSIFKIQLFHNQLIH